MFARRKNVRLTLWAIRALDEVAAIPHLVDVLVDEDGEIASDAAELVNQLLPARIDPDLLFTLDERIRSHSSWHTSVTPARLHYLRVGADCAGTVGVLSCHANGYVRQAGVEMLDREAHSGREIPFLLLRLNDWVPNVRRAAESAIARRLSDSYRGAYLDCLALLSRLQLRKHAAVSPALELIGKMLTADTERLISSALASRDRPSIRAAISAIWNCAQSDEDRAELIQRLITDREPEVRKEAVHRLANAGVSPQLGERFLLGLLNDRSVVIRRTAVGWCAAHDPAKYRDALTAALLDRSGLVRSIAQFYHRKAGDLDLAEFYRARLRIEDDPCLSAAIGGLGETGSKADADAIVPLTHAPGVKMRRAALKALATLAPAAHFDVFLAALMDGQPAISREGRLALEAQRTQFDAQQLLTMFETNSYPHVRSQILTLSGALSKWQQVIFLVRIASRRKEALSERATELLCGWLQGYNRTHQVQPSRQEIAALADAIRACRLGLKECHQRELFALVNPSSHTP